MILTRKTDNKNQEVYQQVFLHVWSSRGLINITHQWSKVCYFGDFGKIIIENQTKFRKSEIENENSI